MPTSGKPYNRLAIASLALVGVGPLTALLVYAAQPSNSGLMVYVLFLAGIPSAIGTWLGKVVLDQINASNSTQGGQWMARVGVIVGPFLVAFAIFIFCLVLFIAFVVMRCC